jgi:hypothetical protein
MCKVVGNGIGNKYIVMKVHLSDKIIAYLTLLSGLTISAVAIYYSVAGLVAIFSAAVIPIIVMGVVLEVSKLVATVWLKTNWSRAPVLIRTYLSVAIAVLMIITSLGIFGFLSKAHSDQSLVSGDVLSRISLYDEKIKIERDNIENARSLIKQMDDAVNGIQANGSDREIKLRDGRTYTRSAAELALSTRRSQAKDRAELTKQIEQAQATIVSLQEQRAPIAAEVRKVEAEVGPIKYIAAFVYGDNPDANLLEKAVTWVIIIIVAVFDPLAVILLLSSQYSFAWFRKVRDEEEEQKSKSINDFVPQPQTLVVDQPDLVAEANAKLAEIEPEVTEPTIPGWMFRKQEPVEPTFDEKKPLEEWNEMIVEAEKAVEEEIETSDAEILNEVSESEKAAMAKWKAEHPDASLKHQRKLFSKGVIDVLPWEKYMLPTAPDLVENEAAIEAAKWAAEQTSAVTPETYMERVDGEQVKKPIEGYQQNAEQNESTLWKRVQAKKGSE